MGNQRKRMAGRYARRAKISGEEAVTISFGFSSLAMALLAGVLEELPYAPTSSSAGIRSAPARSRASAGSSPSPTAARCGTARSSPGA